MHSSDSDERRSEERESHSGLHEIRALARSARQHISKRRAVSETELERDQALLAAASSPGLRAAVAPVPAIDQGRPRTFASGTDATAIMSRDRIARPGGERARGLPVWIYGIVGGALITAVAVFVGFKVTSTDAPAPAATTAANPVITGLPAATAKAAPVMAAEAAPVMAAEAAPTAPALAAKAAPSEPVAAAQPAADDVRIHQNAAQPAADDVHIHQNATRAAAGDVHVHHRAAHPAAADHGHVRHHPARPAAAEASHSSSTPAADDGAVADQALAELLGESPAPAGHAVTEAAPAAPAVPEKKALTKDDVRHALKGITARLSSCHAGDASPNVVVRFTVAPAGTVKTAQATGEHASTAAGKCVVRAVKSARFPATSGRPMTFSLPFFIDP